MNFSIIDSFSSHQKGRNNVFNELIYWFSSVYQTIYFTASKNIHKSSKKKYEAAAIDWQSAHDITSVI